MPDTNYTLRGWLPISLAPEEGCLEVGTIGKTGIVPLGFPCVRDDLGWWNAWSDEPVLIHPTHWRNWRDVSGR